MQHIVDASVVAKSFLPEAHKDKAEKLLRDFLGARVELTAPDLLAAEVANLLWKRSVKLRDISPVQAGQMYGNFLALGLPLRPSSTIAAAALKLAIEKNHPIYDMLYIHSPCGAERMQVRNGRRDVDEEIRRNFRLLALAGRPLGSRHARRPYLTPITSRAFRITGSRWASTSSPLSTPNDWFTISTLSRF